MARQTDGQTGKPTDRENGVLINFAFLFKELRQKSRYINRRIHHLSKFNYGA